MSIDSERGNEGGHAGGSGVEFPEIHLVDRDETTVRWLKRACGTLPGVHVRCGDILDVEVDALISPANSFGFMDGGIDAAYTRAFGPELQARLQQRIHDVHGGELLVGAAEIVRTGGRAPSAPWLIAAPTMRVPCILGKDSVAPYLATRAVLRLVLHGRLEDGKAVSGQVRSLAVPGLGTGVGRVPPQTAARQIGRAIEEARVPPAFPRSWWEASQRHQRLFADEVRDLQVEEGEEG